MPTRLSIYNQYALYAQYAHGIKTIADIALNCRCSTQQVEALFKELEDRGTQITSVTPISGNHLPNQCIVISGHGFGGKPETIPASRGVDTLAGEFRPSLAIVNLGEGQHRWVAGRVGEINRCAIGVYLQSWTDEEIVLKGFSGPLGTKSGKWRIAAGDKLKIIVYGPLNRCGSKTVDQYPDEIAKKRVGIFVAHIG